MLENKFSWYKKWPISDLCFIGVLNPIVCATKFPSFQRNQDEVQVNATLWSSHEIVRLRVRVVGEVAAGGG
jgi:hypothetical protein